MINRPFDRISQAYITAFDKTDGSDSKEYRRYPFLQDKHFLNFIHHHSLRSSEKPVIRDKGTVLLSPVVALVFNLYFIIASRQSHVKNVPVYDTFRTKGKRLLRLKCHRSVAIRKGDGFFIPAGRCGHRPRQLKGEKRIPTGINTLGMTRRGMPIAP